MKIKLGLMLLTTMLSFGTIVYAEDSDEELRVKGLWRDPNTGLTWMRCSLGQIWTGETCTGTAKKYTWWEAMFAANKSTFAGKNDWQLPSVEDLANIRKCTTGESNSKWPISGNNGETIQIFYGCDDDSVSPTIDQSIFPGTNVDSFWTASIDNYSGKVLVIDYNYGLAHDHNESVDHYVRLVRTTRSFDIYKANLAEAKKREAKFLEEIKQQQNDEKQREIEALAEEKKRKIEIERPKLEATLPPQAMYLQAGKYDRNGQQSDAIRLYELLIEKYPNHPLAVQANDRLIGIRLGNEASERAYNDRNQASKECRERKKRYQYGCTAGTANCWEQAQSICSE